MKKPVGGVAREIVLTLADLPPRANADDGSGRSLPGGAPLFTRVFATCECGYVGNSRAVRVVSMVVTAPKPAVARRLIRADKGDVLGDAAQAYLKKTYG